jgi:hypothetical protein
MHHNSSVGTEQFAEFFFEHIGIFLPDPELHFLGSMLQIPIGLIVTMVDNAIFRFPVTGIKKIMYVNQLKPEELCKNPRKDRIPLRPEIPVIWAEIEIPGKVSMVGIGKKNNLSLIPRFEVPEKAELEQLIPQSSLEQYAGHISWQIYFG